MSQTSVPSSDDDIFIVGNEGTPSHPNAASYWQALSDPSNTNYFRADYAPPILDANELIIYEGMQNLVDPLVNTDHTLTIVARWNELTNPQATDFTFSLYTGKPAPNVISFITSVSLLSAGPSSSFSTITYTLSEAEVIAFRADSGYSGFTVVIRNEQNDTLASSNLIFDVSYVSLTVPGGEPLNWWYSGQDDLYKYQATTPGGDYIPAAAPPFHIYGQENPVQGVSTGGTSLIIMGDGFATGATVTINSDPATSVVVVNQHTITCNTPAFDGAFSGTQEIDVGEGVIKSANIASVAVTVTNPDGTSASI